MSRPRLAPLVLVCGGWHIRLLQRRLQGTTCRAGDRILITISAPGRVAERALLTIRNGRLPRAALL